MIVQPDTPRLKSTLGTAPLFPLLRRLRRRAEQGHSLDTGTITLVNLSDGERESIDGLIGRRPSTGSTLSIRLDQLERVIVESGMAGSTREALVALTGPIENARQRRDETRQLWGRLYREASDKLRADPGLEAWLTDVCQRGLLKRLSGRDLDLARRLLSCAVLAVGKLPHPGTTLAQFAAELTGDAHGLDRAVPLGRLVVRAAASLADMGPIRSAGQWRRAWDRVGVSCDELSAPVLVLNLPADPSTLCGVLLSESARFGEPCRLTARQLLRHGPSWEHQSAPRAVYVCENPTVVAAAARRYGPACPPMVCTDGQAATAARMLLRLLVESGAVLWYHGDFDWPGLRMANALIAQFAARPWRMSAADYGAAPALHGLRLKGAPVHASWDARLHDHMRESGRAVHEEHVLGVLLDDLGRPRGPRSSVPCAVPSPGGTAE